MTRTWRALLPVLALAACTPAVRETEPAVSPPPGRFSSIVEVVNNGSRTLRVRLRPAGGPVHELGVVRRDQRRRFMLPSPDAHVALVDTRGNPVIYPTREVYVRRLAPGEGT
ncbi:MAG TPA: hypothetical protein VFQ45_01325 [Longimicrobium sp.]|nr:hypothetical protein [Longimicrobium sp.]